MADNFNLRSFLSENKLTKNAKLLKEGSDYGYEAVMDAVDDMFEAGTPEHDQLTAAVEQAFHNKEIDTTEFNHSLDAPYKQVQAIAQELGLDEAKKETWEEGTEQVVESTLSAKEQALVEMVQAALSDGYGDDNVIKHLSPEEREEKLATAPKYTEAADEEMVQENPLPKYKNIDELMSNIEHGTNEAAHKYKMDRMKEVAEALEAKVSSLEEGENAEHIDQKVVKQMRKDILALRKAEEKLRKEFEKKFASKKEAKEDK